MMQKIILRKEKSTMKFKKVLLMTFACFAIATFTACQSEPATTDGMIPPTSKAEATSTPAPTNAPTATDVPTETPEPTATSTPTPSSEPTTTSTPTPTNTPTPTPSPSPEPTATSTPSPTPTATSTPTPTPSPEPTQHVLKASTCPHGNELHILADHTCCDDIYGFSFYDGNTFMHYSCETCGMVLECYDGINITSVTGDTHYFEWRIATSETGAQAVCIHGDEIHDYADHKKCNDKDIAYVRCGDTDYYHICCLGCQKDFYCYKVKRKPSEKPDTTDSQGSNVCVHGVTIYDMSEHSKDCYFPCHWTEVNTVHWKLNKSIGEHWVCPICGMCFECRGESCYWYIRSKTWFEFEEKLLSTLEPVRISEDNNLYTAPVCPHGTILSDYTEHADCYSDYNIDEYNGTIDGDYRTLGEHYYCKKCGRTFECYDSDTNIVTTTTGNVVGLIDYLDVPVTSIPYPVRPRKSDFKGSEAWDEITEKLINTGIAKENVYDIYANIPELDDYSWTYWNGNKANGDTSTSLTTSTRYFIPHDLTYTGYQEYSILEYYASSPGYEKWGIAPNIVIGIINKTTGEFVFSTNCNDLIYRKNDGRETIGYFKFTNGDEGMVTSVIKNNAYLLENERYKSSMGGLSFITTYHCDFQIRFDEAIDTGEYAWFITSCDMETWLANEDWYYDNSFTVVDDFYGNINRMWTEGADIHFWEIRTDWDYTQ